MGTPIVGHKSVHHSWEAKRDTNSAHIIISKHPAGKATYLSLRRRRLFACVAVYNLAPIGVVNNIPRFLQFFVVNMFKHTVASFNTLLSEFIGLWEVLGENVPNPEPGPTFQEIWQRFLIYIFFYIYTKILAMHVWTNDRTKHTCVSQNSHMRRSDMIKTKDRNTILVY